MRQTRVMELRLQQASSPETPVLALLPLSWLRNLIAGFRESMQLRELPRHFGLLICM